MRINVASATGGMGQGKDAAGAGTNNLEACWQGLADIARHVI